MRTHIPCETTGFYGDGCTLLLCEAMIGFGGTSPGMFGPGDDSGFGHAYEGVELEINPDCIQGWGDGLCNGRGDHLLQINGKDVLNYGHG